MNTKILTSVGCLLMVAATMAPSVFGHSERAPLAADQGSGYTGAPSGLVSGRYVGAAGPALALEAYIDPEDTLSSGGMLCDAEVIIDSNTAGQGGETNEPNVDGSPTVGLQPTDLVDDGGAGGACHTNHYTTGIFNTPGCQAGTQVSGGTHAGTDIWVGASCDWKEDQGGTSSEQTLLLCLTNSLLAFNPLVILGPPTPDLAAFLAEVQTFIDCINDFVTCATDPTCGATGATQICGADSTADAVNYGYAGVGAAITPANFPTATGIVNPPPGVTGPCAPTDETAMVFVFDTVATNGFGPNTLGSVDVYLALTGEVFSVPSAPSVPPPFPPVCTSATAGNPAVVALACTDPTDPNEACTPWVSFWDPVAMASNDFCFFP